MTPTHTMPDVGAMMNMNVTEADVMQTCEAHGFPLDPEQLEVVAAVVNQMLLSASKPATPQADAAIAAGEAREQEPVAEVYEHRDGSFRIGVQYLVDPPPVGTKLYAAPLPREAATVINGHVINDLFLKWSEWTTELGEAISRKNIDRFVSELRALLAASHAAPTAQAAAPKPTMQQISDYLHTLDTIERGLVERDARALRSALAAAPAQSGEAVLPAWFDMFLMNVCEIPDRNSPEDQPEAIVATPEELKSCALNAIEQFDAAPQAAREVQSGNPVAWERLAAAWLRGRAAFQAQNNERWPEHAKAYDRWRYYVTIAQALADELEGKALRPRDTLDPQPAQTAVEVGDSAIIDCDIDKGRAVGAASHIVRDSDNYFDDEIRKILRATTRVRLVERFEHLVKARARSPQATTGQLSQTAPTLSEEVLMRAIADTAGCGHPWASRALCEFRAAQKETSGQPAGKGGRT